MKQNITIGDRNYSVDIEQAKKLGVLTETYPLCPGDVYVSKPGNDINPFLLVAAHRDGDYGEITHYQLLGIDGVKVNSSDYGFFGEVHTLDEIEGYLMKKDMVYARNISFEIKNLVDNCRK